MKNPVHARIVTGVVFFTHDNYSARIHVFFGKSKLALVHVDLGEGPASLHDVLSILYFNKSAIKIQDPRGALVLAEEISARKCSDNSDGRQPLFEEEPTALIMISHKKRPHKGRCRSARRGFLCA